MAAQGNRADFVSPVIFDRQARASALESVSGASLTVRRVELDPEFGILARSRNASVVALRLPGASSATLQHRQRCLSIPDAQTQLIGQGEAKQRMTLSPRRWVRSVRSAARTAPTPRSHHHQIAISSRSRTVCTGATLREPVALLRVRLGQGLSSALLQRKCA
ncbi:uncharacterized protein PSANT_06069 [Moesziomyces antarcticus]|uniref:Uncharacterized protein n=1 Tax=Pseudozyma antarctica TaxID=84753 RepID=A0A5C3FVZ3_PSEA2|nr:uncharacterized protein PSANT_06069 [Moesziomyces antarcticus]